MIFKFLRMYTLLKITLGDPTLITGISGALITFGTALVGFVTETKTKKPVILFILALIGSAVTITSAFFQNSDGNEKSSVLSEANRKSDSTVTANVTRKTDSVTRIRYNDISVAFHKQGLVLDTMSQTIKRVRDSSTSRKFIINNFPQKDPLLTLEKCDIDNKSDTGQTIQFYFKSLAASSTNFNISGRGIITFTEGPTRTFTMNNAIDKETRISEDVTMSTGVDIKNSRNVKSITVYFKGRYTNIDNSRQYKIDEVFFYDFETKKHGSFVSPFREEEISKILLSMPKSQIKQ